MIRTTITIPKETKRLLKHIQFLTEETQNDVLKRLLQAELERVLRLQENRDAA